jgi:8-amino-7-oxononanoate synthase
LPEPIQQIDRTYVLSSGRKLIYFAGCDYFRLASHPKVINAFLPTLRKVGLSVSASRKTTGNHQLFGQLESALAQFFHGPRAVLVGTGYITNLVVAQALQGQFSHALLDERAHPSLQDASVLLGVPVRRFRHRDPAHLAQVLQRCGANATPLLLTDGMFSHDGSLAPMADYLKVLPRKALILLDEAHSAGVLGNNGRGTLEHLALPAERVIRTLTLSKAFGVYGGAILCTAEVRNAILQRSSMFAGHTPVPLPLVHAALVSLRLLKANPRMRARLLAQTALAKSDLRKAGLPIPENPSPIIPWIPGTPTAARKLKASLREAGIYPSFIRYPGGPEHGYFRFVLSSEHTALQIRKLVNCLKATLTR